MNQKAVGQRIAQMRRKAIANVLQVSADELLLDVLDCTAKVEATELYHEIEDLPSEKRNLILKLVRVLVSELKEA